MFKIAQLAMVFAFLNAPAMAQDSTPHAVQHASKSVFRILFLPPKDELTFVPMNTYEEKIEGYFYQDSFMGWWFRKVGSQCRKDKKQECPIMADIVWTDKETFIPIGSAFLAGDQKTVYTAAHVWVRFDRWAKLLAGADLLDKEKRSKARAELGRSADFILFDASGEIVFNTHDDTDRASLREYVVPELLYLLYPKNLPPIVNDNFEFAIFNLSRAMSQPALEFGKVHEVSDAPNGIDIRYGTPLFSLGVPDSRPRVNKVAIVRSTLSRDFVGSREIVPNSSKEAMHPLELITFSLDQAVMPGMSGGPIVNEMGQVVSINSSSGAIIPVEGLQVNDLENKPIRRVLLGVHPRWLPGVRIDR